MALRLDLNAGIASTAPINPEANSKWVNEWATSSAASLVNQAINVAKAPPNPCSPLPRLPYEYGHEVKRGLVVWDKALDDKETFRAFYSPVAICLMQCICQLRWDTWDRWWCGPCATTVSVNPLEHITNLKHIKKVRGAA